MENRSVVVKELFELRVLLNKSNKLANQQSELNFGIDDTQFIAFAAGEKSPSFILLANRKSIKEKWQISSIPYFYTLRKELVEELNNAQTELKSYLRDPKDINEILLFHMKQLLRSLFLEKSI